jgi:hypothetical protein
VVLLILPKINIAMKKIYFLLPLFAVILGCSSASDKAPESFSSSSEKGLAIGTITFEGDVPRNDIYRFFYNPVTTDKKVIKQNKGKIQILGRIDKKRAYSGDFNNSKSYLFVIEREPGNYAFTDYNVLNQIGPTGAVSFSPKFSIPFEIKKGEIAYIGEVTYIENAEKGTPKIIVANYMERDLTEFKKKFPKIPWNLTVDKTVKSGDTGGGMVDFR